MTLRQAAFIRRRAIKTLEDANSSFALAVMKAAEDGMPKTEIARQTGVSRQTIHEILRR